MDQATSIVLIEGSKVLLQAYFNFLRQAGKTPEEIDLLYKQEKAQFEMNNPNDLEDV